MKLRQPLAIIGGFARRMSRQIDSGEIPASYEQRESCGIMVSEIRRLEKILSNLIDFNRRETVEFQRIDPNAVVNKVSLKWIRTR